MVLLYLTNTIKKKRGVEGELGLQNSFRETDKFKLTAWMDNSFKL